MTTLALIKKSSDLSFLVREVDCQQNLTMARVSNWKIGGIAPYIFYPKSLEELKAVKNVFEDLGIKVVYVSMTTNLIFEDGLFECVFISLIKLNTRIAKVANTVSVGAGVWVPHAARWLCKQGVSGFEHMCGIPGSMGGLVFMNGGSQRKSIGNNIISVTAYVNEKLVKYSGHECDFGYRSSVFQGGGVILSAELDASLKRSSGEIRSEMLSILRSRRLKFPRKEPNCGSVFMSSPEMYEAVGPPGLAIEKVGLKGVSSGGAQISPLHANFIVNNGGARCTDILKLIELCADKVEEVFGFIMKPEVRLVRLNGVIEAL